MAASQWMAKTQADRIMDYWHGKGHRHVRAWVQYVPKDGYAVRSNLIGGLPPD
jgi:hypothetical protein